MRIVDTQKRKDYYDCIQQYGQDRSIVWVRKPTKIEWAKSPLHTKSLNTRYTDMGHFTGFAVGFCGKLYHGVKFTAHDEIVQGGNYKTYCFYNIKALDKFVINRGDKDLEKKYFNAFRSRYAFRGGLTSCYRDRIVSHLDNDYINDQKINKKVIAQKLLDNKFVTLFMDTEHETIIANTNELSKVDFVKVFDPLRAFQEISMYVGGILSTPIKPIPDIPDRVMAESKGFDKWSFRKEPSMRK